VLLLLWSAACATTGASGKGDENLPSEQIGPFRKLAAEEVQGIAPFVLDDKNAAYREPTAIVEGDSIVLFAVARRDGKDVIVRTRATDGRSFFGTSADFGRLPEVVLSPDQPWEGGALSGPFVLRRGAELLLYYAGKGGIGVARSTDGHTFTKERGPVLARDTTKSPWEATELAAPGAYLLPDGRTRLLYSSGSAIGEAESDDGVSFRRFDPYPATPVMEPVLVPSPPPAPGSLAPNEKPPFDTARVADPCPTTKTTPAGRFHLRVLYTGEGDGGATAIGYAGRYGDGGPLERQPLPVYSVNQREAAPAFVEAASGLWLYVHQNRTQGNAVYPAIAAGFAPAADKLPPPGSFPDTP
jgi:hypothetical protein